MDIWKNSLHKRNTYIYRRVLNECVTEFAITHIGNLKCVGNLKTPYAQISLFYYSGNVATNFSNKKFLNNCKIFCDKRSQITSNATKEVYP